MTDKERVRDLIAALENELATLRQDLDSKLSETEAAIVDCSSSAEGSLSVVALRTRMRAVEIAIRRAEMRIQ